MKRRITTIDEESDDEDKVFDAPGASSLDVVPSFAPPDQPHRGMISESSSEDDHQPPLTQDKKMLVSGKDGEKDGGSELGRDKRKREEEIKERRREG